MKAVKGFEEITRQNEMISKKMSRDFWRLKDRTK